jgi:hypothetical protein
MFVMTTQWAGTPQAKNAFGEHIFKNCLSSGFYLGYMERQKNWLVLSIAQAVHPGVHIPIHAPLVFLFLNFQPLLNSLPPKTWRSKSVESEEDS